MALFWNILLAMVLAPYQALSSVWTSLVGERFGSFAIRELLRGHMNKLSDCVGCFPFHVYLVHLLCNTVTNAVTIMQCNAVGGLV